MSWSPIGNRVTYNEYMMAHEFVEDLKSTTNAASQRLSMDISRQTRDVIASNEALAAENIRATELVSGAVDEGFTRLSYDMQGISSGISELNSSFHWGA